MIDTDNKSFVISTLHELNPSIKVISFNRPSKSNSYNSEFLEAFYKELKLANNDTSINAIVITGIGKSFCAGADLVEIKGRRAEDGIFLKSREVFDYLAAISKITIASINGPAIGGGLELALACDIRICAPIAKFSFPEIDFALTPAAGGMRRIPAFIGKSRSKEMILFGRELNAQEALEWGLVSYMGEDFMVVATQHACRIASLNQLAVCLAKKVIDGEKKNEQSDFESVVQALLYERKFIINNQK
jgi:enoyl-CoA hydratase/carnithine racemase